MQLQRGITILALVSVVATAIPLAAPRAAGAQGPHAAPLTWDDAPIVPRHRSEADWLFDVGWNTYADVYGPFRTHEYEVGEEEWFVPLGSVRTEPDAFVLRYRTEHAYFWFQRGIRVDMAELEAAAAFLEERIWPMNEALYGDASLAGIDGDRRLHIVNQIHIDNSLMGAFNPEDQCPQFLCPDSNQREIIYINLDIAPVNSEDYLGTLAHEHQHMLRYHADGNERRWLDEGLSQLAEHLNGFDPMIIAGHSMSEFLQDPDHHLNGWSNRGYDVARYYGASYLFLVYLFERFGTDFIQALTLSPYDGLAAVHHTLALGGTGLTVDDVFADWIVTNYLDDPYVADGRYQYMTLDLPVLLRPQRLYLTQANTYYTDLVNQYGADYLALSDPGTYRLSFYGGNVVPLLHTDPASGNWVWWSYNSPDSASRLSAAFDLTGLSTATLAFRAWWDIEPHYDWFQVLASADEGRSWQVIGGPHAATEGLRAPGPYYGGQSAGWVDEQIDLGAYAGGTVWLRFEYLTDSTDTLPGVVLDDIRIPELGYEDDVEQADSVWRAEGFVRTTALVAQHWTVAAITHPAAGDPVVESLALDAYNSGEMVLTVPAGGRVTLAVGAMAPFTEERAGYRLTIEPLAP